MSDAGVGELEQALRADAEPARKVCHRPEGLRSLAPDPDPRARFFPLRCPTIICYGEINIQRKCMLKLKVESLR